MPYSDTFIQNVTAFFLNDDDATKNAIQNALKEKNTKGVERILAQKQVELQQKLSVNGASEPDSGREQTNIRSSIMDIQKLYGALRKESGVAQNSL